MPSPIRFLRTPRTIALAVVPAIALALCAPSALAVGLYSGPWDSAHEPPTINDPELLVGGIREGRFVVFPSAEEPNAFCPSSWAVTFQDPMGSVTETMMDTTEGHHCIRAAQQTTTGTPDFTVSNSYGDITEFTFNNPEITEAPFLYTVTDASGAVIAQGPYTRMHGTFRINSGSPNFESTCLDRHHTLYSDPGTGVIYCLDTETFDKDGWPAPPIPPASPRPSTPAVPVEAAIPPRPKTCPKGRRKVRRGGHVHCVKVRHPRHRVRRTARS